MLSSGWRSRVTSTRSFRGTPQKFRPRAGGEPGPIVQTVKKVLRSTPRVALKSRVHALAVKVVVEQLPPRTCRT